MQQLNILKPYIYAAVKHANTFNMQELKMLTAYIYAKVKHVKTIYICSS